MANRNSKRVSVADTVVQASAATEPVSSDTHAASAVRAMSQPRVAKLSNKLPTPINVDKLRDYLSGYDQLKASFLIDCFSKGFRLGVSNASYSSAIPRNHASTFANPSVLHAKIKKEVALGRYVSPFPRPPFNKFVPH